MRRHASGQNTNTNGRLRNQSAALPMQRLANPSPVSGQGRRRKRLRRTQKSMGLQRLLCKKSRVTAPAAQLLLLVYNLWCLFSRLLEPGRHIEASGSRRWFMIIGAKLVKSSRKTSLLISAQGSWWQQLKHSYQRVILWLRSTAPHWTSSSLLLPLLPYSTVESRIILTTCASFFRALSPSESVQRSHVPLERT